MNDRYSAVKKTGRTAHLLDLLDLQKLIKNNIKKKKRERRPLNTAIYEFYEFAVIFKMLLSWCSCSFFRMQSRPTEYPAILKFSQVIRKQ